MIDEIDTEAELQELKALRTPPAQVHANPIEPSFRGKTGVIIATGPSLTDEHLRLIKEHHDTGNIKVFTINNVYQRVPWTDVHLSCDGPWWRWYYPRSEELRNLPCPKYTWYPKLAERYGIEYVTGIEKSGVSTDPSVIHINHGSGPMCINLAMHFGVERILLIGHDMKFAPDYNGRTQDPGSQPRHYFDEYPKPLQHWPSVKVGLTKPGVLDGLIEAYNKMAPQLQKLGIKVINCTPDSALTSFQKSTLEKEL